MMLSIICLFQHGLTSRLPSEAITLSWDRHRHGYLVEVRVGTDMLGRLDEDEPGLSAAFVAPRKGLSVDRSNLVRLGMVMIVMNTVDAGLRDLVSGPEEFSGVVRHF